MAHTRKQELTARSIALWVFAAVSLLGCDPVRVAINLGVQPTGIACNETLPPLAVAVHQSDANTVKSLLSSGVNPNTPYVFCSGPAYYLRTAINKGNVEVVRLLLSNGANPNVMVNQSTPLLIATTRENYNVPKEARLEILSLLIAYGVDVNAKENLPSP